MRTIKNEIYPIFKHINSRSNIKNGIVVQESKAKLHKEKERNILKAVRDKVVKSLSSTDSPSSDLYLPFIKFFQECVASCRCRKSCTIKILNGNLLLCFHVPSDEAHKVLHLVSWMGESSIDS